MSSSTIGRQLLALQCDAAVGELSSACRRQRAPVVVDPSVDVSGVDFVSVDPSVDVTVVVNSVVAAVAVVVVVMSVVHFGVVVML